MDPDQGTVTDVQATMTAGRITGRTTVTGSSRPPACRAPTFTAIGATLGATLVPATS